MPKPRYSSMMKLCGFQAQAAAQMAAEIFAEVFRTVAGQQQGRIVPKVVVNLLTVGNGVVAAQVVQEEVHAAGKAFQKLVAVERQQKFRNRA